MSRIVNITRSIVLREEARQDTEDLHRESLMTLEPAEAPFAGVLDRLTQSLSLSPLPSVSQRLPLLPLTSRLTIGHALTVLSL